MIILRLLHFIFGTIWVGGGFYSNFILLPKLRQMDAGPQTLRHKLDVLKRRCDNLDRNYDEIDRTVTAMARPAKEMIEQCRQAAELGIDEVMLVIPDLHEMRPLELLAREVIPAIAEF